MGERVECHSGFTYADRPVALTWEGQRLEIIRIMAEWRTPENKNFRVLTADRLEFELGYNQAKDEWHIHCP
jgi:hypothetical protein